MPAFSRFCAIYLALAAPFAAAESAIEIAEELDLVPTPQEMRLDGESLPVAGFSIVAAPGSALARTGAAEINARIAELGGPALPVVESMPSGPAIVVAPIDSPLARSIPAAQALGVEALGEQAYAIETARIGGRPAVLAIGADEPGALYACMTLRRTIQKRDGAVRLLGAIVRDWPEFKVRCLGKPRAAASGERQIKIGPDPVADYVSENAPYIQWMARHKINMAVIDAPAGSAYSAEVRARAQRALTDYAKQYGIRSRLHFGTAITRYLTDDVWTKCIVRQDSRYCWTAFDAHAKNAEDYAARASQAGIDYFCLHAIDSGGMLDPEKWPERCERCRAYYGDDHARAAIDQFTRYYNAYKALSPDGLFEAVVLPYHFQWTVEGFADDPVKFGKTLPHMGWIRGLENDPALARQCVADLKAYHAKIAEGLPRDVAVTFREAGRAEFDGVCDLWKDHPVNIWYYLGRNRGWVGLWEPQCRMLKTWKRDEPHDTLCYEGSNHTGVVPPIWVAGSAEYAWSMRQPDASDQFQTTSRFYDTEGRNVTDYQRDSLIPRILRALWHPRIAEAVAPLFANNLSFNYIADPEAAAASGDGENWDDPFVHLEPAVAILPGVAERLRALVAAIDAGEPLGAGGGDIRREYGYQWLMYLYETVHLASAKAQMDWAAYRAGMSAARGDLAQARAIADAAIERLPGLIETQGQVKARMDADAYVMRRPSKRAGASEYRLAQFPLDKQAARLRAIAADAEQAAERPEAGATRISLTEAARENRTVDYGLSTIVRFRPAAVFEAPVKGAKLSIAVKEGAETLGERTLEIGAAAGRWSALKLLDFDLGKVAKGDLRIEATLLCEGAAAKTFVFAMAPDGAVAPK